MLLEIEMMDKIICTERTNLFEPNDGIGIKFTILGSLLESQLLLAFDTVVEKMKPYIQK